jgi:hypothetical protein
MSFDDWDRKDLDHPIDYTYLMWQFLKKRRLSGYKWDVRAAERKDIMIDDILPPQGSMFFMTRKHFDRMGFMKMEGYTGWGQEGEEVCFATMMSGGRCVVNKNTWYTHLHKGQMHGRMYAWFQPYDSYEYSFNYWVHENRDFFVKAINKFLPIPNFPSDWEEKLYGQS